MKNKTKPTFVKEYDILEESTFYDILDRINTYAKCGWTLHTFCTRQLRLTAVMERLTKNKIEGEKQ